MNLHTFEVSLEWAGTFFLAAEAIKLHNLALVRERLQTFGRKALKVFYGKGTSGWDEVRYILVTLSLGTAAAIMTLRALDVELVTAIPRALARRPPPVGISASDLILINAIGFALSIPVLIMVGAAIFAVGVGAMALAIGSLKAIERNTESGVIGIIGFGLFSIAAIMKLAGHGVQLVE